MISNNTETALKRFVPLAVFTGAAWYTYKKRENIKESVLFGGIVALLAYLAIGPIIKALANMAARGSAGTYELANIPQGWKAEPIATRFYNDMHGFSGLTRKDSTVYSDASRLNDDQLVAVYNYWRRAFQSNHDNLTLTQAMEDETYFDQPTKLRVQTLISRLHAHNCP